MLTYTAFYYLGPDGVHAEVADYPGVVSCGDDLASAREGLGGALVDMLESDLTDGRPIPPPSSIEPDSEADLVEPMRVLLTAGRAVVTEIVTADS